MLLFSSEFTILWSNAKQNSILNSVFKSEFKQLGRHNGNEQKLKPTNATELFYNNKHKCSETKRTQNKMWMNWVLVCVSCVEGTNINWILFPAIVLILIERNDKMWCGILQPMAMYVCRIYDLKRQTLYKFHYTHARTHARRCFCF